MLQSLNVVTRTGSLLVIKLDHVVHFCCPHWTLHYSCFVIWPCDISPNDEQVCWASAALDGRGLRFAECHLTQFQRVHVLVCRVTDVDGCWNWVNHSDVWYLGVFRRMFLLFWSQCSFNYVMMYRSWQFHVALCIVRRFTSKTQFEFLLSVQLHDVS